MLRAVEGVHRQFLGLVLAVSLRQPHLYETGDEAVHVVVVLDRVALERAVVRDHDGVRQQALVSDRELSHHDHRL